MRLSKLFRLFVLAAAVLPIYSCRRGEKPALNVGARAPAFSLPGTDGRTHSLQDYATSRVLVMVFTSNACPESQLYERRIQQLHKDYAARGAAVIAINPNNPGAVRLADMRYTDVGESLDDMKSRAAFRRLEYPYLSDGAMQALVKQVGVVTTPHVFIFDESRALQYEGRIDDNVREELVKTADARNAIDALLAGRPVPVSHTRPTGCAVKGLTGVLADEDLARFARSPVNVEMAGADELKRLRQNGTGKLLLINFWATWCAPCATEFPDLETTYRMFQPRGLEFVSVSVNDPAERPAVIDFLTKHHASHRNVLFATSDVYGLQAAFDPNMPAPVPFTLLLAPNGDVLYQQLGELDSGKLRRAILANLPADPRYPDSANYWALPELPKLP